MSTAVAAGWVPAVTAAIAAGMFLGGTLAAATGPRLLEGRHAPLHRRFVAGCAVGTGLAVGVLALRFDGVELLAFGFLACVGVTAAAIDVVERRR